MSAAFVLLAKYWRAIAATVSILAIVAVALFYRAYVFGLGQEAGRNEIRATELALCKGEYADLQKATALQSAAIATLGRDTQAAQAKASAAQAAARPLHIAAQRKASQVSALAASDCSTAARQVWEIIQ